MRADKDRQS
ncbi:hypothetical protein YPPY59_1671, partial [Yersinia pestis PY-59]